MKIPKFKRKKMKVFLKKLPKILAEKAFLTFLALFLAALIWGGILFYKYNILIKTAEIETIGRPLQFQEKTYQEIIRIWEEKEKKLLEIDFKTYPDPFR